jgi:hypothetical protein
MLGAGVIIGALPVAAYFSSRPLHFPEQLLHASASHGTSTMAMATGSIDGNEGLFVLDFITGELQCLVINPKNGKVGGVYRHNVVQNLEIEQGKRPDYLLVTGETNLHVAGGAAQCVVYVGDANTGRYVAYMLPWNRQAAVNNVGQVNPMRMLYTGKTRNVDIE